MIVPTTIVYSLLVFQSDSFEIFIVPTTIVYSLLLFQSDSFEIFIELPLKRDIVGNITSSFHQFPIEKLLLFITIYMNTYTHPK
jgi:hypothetical protein